MSNDDRSWQVALLVANDREYGRVVKDYPAMSDEALAVEFSLRYDVTYSTK